MGFMRSFAEHLHDSDFSEDGFKFTRKLLYEAICRIFDTDGISEPEEEGDSLAFHFIDYIYSFTQDDDDTYPFYIMMRVVGYRLIEVCGVECFNGVVKEILNQNKTKTKK